MMKYLLFYSKSPSKSINIKEIKDKQNDVNNPNKIFSESDSFEEEIINKIIINKIKNENSSINNIEKKGGKKNI